MNFMKIEVRRDVVEEMREDIDQFLELWRQAYIEKRPIDGAEWRMGMNLLVKVKVYITNELDKEKAND